MRFSRYVDISESFQMVSWFWVQHMLIVNCMRIGILLSYWLLTIEARKQSLSKGIFIFLWMLNTYQCIISFSGKYIFINWYFWLESGVWNDYMDYKKKKSESLARSYSSVYYRYILIELLSSLYSSSLCEILYKFYMAVSGHLVMHLRL